MAESHLSTNQHHIKHTNGPLCINITCEHIPAIQVLTIYYHNHIQYMNKYFIESLYSHAVYKVLASVVHIVMA